MGFWQGVANAYSDIRNQRREERLIEEEREAQQKALSEERKRQDAIRKEEMAFQRSLREEDRAFDREMLTTRLMEERRDILLKRAGENSSLGEDAGLLASKTEALAARLGDAAETEEGQAILSNPLAAAKLEDLVRSREEEFAKAGNPIEISGYDLLEASNAFGLSSVEGASMEEILTATSERLDAIYTQGLPTPTTPYVTLDPTVMPDPKTLSEGRDAVSREVLRLANQELGRVSDDPAMAANLQKLIDNFDPDSPTQETEALLTRFGPKAYENVSAMDNIYTQGLDRDPFMQRFINLPQQAQDTIRALNDPNIPPEQAMQLRELLFNRYGIQY